MGHNEATTDPHFPDETHSYVPQAALLVAWCITWNYDSSVIFIILLLELGLMQPGQLWGFRHGGCCARHKSSPGAFTCMHTHIHTQRLCALSLLIYWCTKPQTVDQWIYGLWTTLPPPSFKKKRGLGKQCLEPTDHFAVHYPICWNTIAALPVTLARTWQNGPVDQLLVVSLTKEFRQYIFEPILFSLYCHLLNSFNGISYHYYDDV